MYRSSCWNDFSCCSVLFLASEDLEFGFCACLETPFFFVLNLFLFKRKWIPFVIFKRMCVYGGVARIICFWVYKIIFVITFNPVLIMAHVPSAFLINREKSELCCDELLRLVEGCWLPQRAWPSFGFLHYSIFYSCFTFSFLLLLTNLLNILEITKSYPQVPQNDLFSCLLALRSN